MRAVENPATRCFRHSRSRTVGSGGGCGKNFAGDRPQIASARSKTTPRKAAKGEAVLGRRRIARANEGYGANLIVGGALGDDVTAADPETPSGLEHLAARMAARKGEAQLRRANRGAALKRPIGNRVDADESFAQIEFKPFRLPVGEMKGLPHAPAPEQSAGHVVVAETPRQLSDATPEFLKG
jgi:hypothetical protein